MPFEARHEFSADLLLVADATRAGVVPSRARAADKSWEKWTEFCISLHQDPQLSDIDDPVILIQVFAQRIRDGRSAKGGKPVRSGTVDDTVRDVGQAFAFMGAPDPRLNSAGKIDFRLTRQLRSYTKIDPPPARVKPIPIQIIRHAVASVHNDPAPKPAQLAAADMLIAAFYFLMRPGEHCQSSSEAHPFRLQDVEMFCGSHRLDIQHATESELFSSTFMKLTFTTQKNGVQGEKIGHGCSGDLLLCPIRAILRRIIHLRKHNAPMDTPLHYFYLTQGGRPNATKSIQITKLVRQSAAAIGAPLGILPSDIDARSLRASGAMALLCARVDRDWVQLLGRWRSDSMLRYLHVQAAPVMQSFAQKMLLGGEYSFLPTQQIPLHMSA
jgi:hypothetical protein